MISNVSLLDHLADALPAGLKLRVYHISTPPTPSSALFSAAPGLSEERTLCESHFLSIALPGRGAERGEILVYALEVLVLTTEHLTTIFISKADSSGFLHLLKTPKGSNSIIRTITTQFLRFLVDTRPQGSRLVLSLFARSQSAYLFPGSVENAEKHILDDRQLIKWWCRVVDPFVRGHPVNGIADNSFKAVAHLIVPGCDKSETRAFFPATARLDPSHQARWFCSYPVEQLTEDPSSPLRCLIPRLPDDPKARFLKDLDAEHVNDQGQWRSIRSLEQFWEMMSYRQECSAGRLVGFIWVVFEIEPKSAEAIDNGGFTYHGVAASDQRPSMRTPSPSQVDLNTLASRVAYDSTDHTPIPLPTSPLPSSPTRLPVSAPSADAATNLGSHGGEEIMKGTVDSSTPSSGKGRGELVLGADVYELLMDHLLELDFAGQEQAVKESGNWINKAACLAKTPTWGKSLVGRCPVSESVKGMPFSDGEAGDANALVGVGKKRKAEVMDTDLEKTPLSNAAISATPPPIALAYGLVRKKPKKTGTWSPPGLKTT